MSSLRNQRKGVSLSSHDFSDMMSFDVILDLNAEWLGQAHPRWSLGHNVKDEEHSKWKEKCCMVTFLPRRKIPAPLSGQPWLCSFPCLNCYWLFISQFRDLPVFSQWLLSFSFLVAEPYIFSYASSLKARCGQVPKFSTIRCQWKFHVQLP